MTLLDFFQDVYVKLRMQDATKGAIEQYHVCISRYSRHLKRRATLVDLNEMAVAEWISAMMAEGLSRRTINGRLNMLLTLWRMSKRRKLIDTDLEDVRRLKLQKRPPRAWTVAQMTKIIESCRQAEGRFVGVSCDRWWVTLVLVLYDTGLRLRSAVSIRFDEIDFERKVLRVPAERMKNFCEQTFPLTDQTLEAIIASVPPRRSALFPYPSKWQKDIYGRFKVILQRAGLPTTRRDLFHKIRRTTATHIAVAAGESAAVRQLGHQDSSTIKRYIDPTFLSDHDLAKHLPRPAWNDPKRLSVELVSGPDDTGVPLVKIRRRVRDFAGKDNDDLFARLHRQKVLTPDDVAEAIDRLGLLYRDLAPHVGCSGARLGAILNGKHQLGPSMERRIRVALGLSYEHRQQVPEGPRNRKRDQLRKRGAT
jgi:integrase